MALPVCIKSLGALAALAFGATQIAGPYSRAELTHTPVCANGTVRYILLDLTGEGPGQPGQDPSPCHGACVMGRKNPKAGINAGA